LAAFQIQRSLLKNDRIPLEAAGAPTIAPAIGGIAETIRDGVDGLLYKFRDAKELEQKMRRVLEEPELVRRLIANLRPVPDTRERGAAVEQFCYQVLAGCDERSSVQRREHISHRLTTN
jgi:glycosyltransferase involved in cell wall biosynthesis